MRLLKRRASCGGRNGSRSLGRKDINPAERKLRLLTTPPYSQGLIESVMEHSIGPLKKKRC